MNQNEKLALLKRLQDNYDAIDALSAALKPLFSDDVGFGGLFCAMWRQYDFTLDMAEKLLGDEPGPGQSWLRWHVWENDWGRKGLECQVGKTKRKMKTAEDLLWAIKKTNEQG